MPRRLKFADKGDRHDGLQVVRYSRAKMHNRDPGSQFSELIRTSSVLALCFVSAGGLATAGGRGIRVPPHVRRSHQARTGRVSLPG